MLKCDEIEQPASCLNKSAIDEPVFVLCARDPVAAMTVRNWAVNYTRMKVSRGELGQREKDKVNDAYALADAMDNWGLARGLVDPTGRPTGA